MSDNDTSDISVSTLDKNLAAKEGPSDGLTWHDPAQAPMRLLGFPWFEADQVYRRMPQSALDSWRPELVDLARCTTGGQVQFTTNSKRVAVKVTLSGSHDMTHMPATGECGFDLYEGTPGNQRFVGVARFELAASEYTVEIYAFPTDESRTLTLNFPLYKGVEEVRVGLDTGAEVLSPPPLAHRIAVYGTSIVHGGCCSRPGMNYPNILSRRFGAEVLNFGFSGNAHGDLAVAEALATLDPCELFVLDYDANVFPEQMRATLPGFVDALRGRHPNTPILVVTRPAFAHEHYQPENAAHREDFLMFHTGFVEERRAAGDANIHHYDGTLMMGQNPEECTVDGVHPTDLGFMRMADSLEPVIRGLLG